MGGALTHLNGRLGWILNWRVSSARGLNSQRSLPERPMPACYSQCWFGSRGGEFGSFTARRTGALQRGCCGVD
jgi:hypothetical protein